MFASLTAYLQDLQESGVDGIPAEMTTAEDAAPLRAAHADQDIKSPMNDKLNAPKKHETLEQIRKDLGACQRCKLGATRKNLVFGAGNPKARLVFVGEPPEADEVAACMPFLLRQLASIGPEVIVALGSSAAQALLQTKVPISKLRGKFHDFHGTPLMPTYHPSYLLRSGGNSDSFWSVWDDMTQVLQLLKLPVPNKSRNK